MAAVNYAKGVISDLLQNKVDMSLLVVSKVGCNATSWSSERWGMVGAWTGGSVAVEVQRGGPCGLRALKPRPVRVG